MTHKCTHSHTVNSGGNQATLTISGTNIQIPLGPNASNTTAAQSQSQGSSQNTTIQGSNMSSSTQGQTAVNQTGGQSQQQNTFLTIPTGNGQTIQIPASAFSATSAYFTVKNGFFCMLC